jgi:hypothetical protein
VGVRVGVPFEVSVGPSVPFRSCREPPTDRGSTSTSLSTFLQEEPRYVRVSIYTPQTSHPSSPVGPLPTDGVGSTGR